MTIGFLTQGEAGMTNKLLAEPRLSIRAHGELRSLNAPEDCDELFGCLLPRVRRHGPFLGQVSQGPEQQLGYCLIAGVV